MSLSLGQQISHHRKRTGLSQKKLAEFVGVTPAALSQYENGRREPNIVVITSIARVFDITIDSLLGLEPLPDLIAQNRSEYVLLRDFRCLNNLGQKRILDDLAGLKELPKYYNSTG